MVLTAAWALAVLGVAHIFTGLVWFRKPIGEALKEGGFGKFQGIDSRRLAFWFTIFGVLVMGLGHVAILAVMATNLSLLKLIGFYMLALSVTGTLAQPRSPFWIALALSPIFIGAGYGWWA
ncbi:MAG: DUF6463 family protein [Burkholderiaceae bacterium]